MTFSIEQATNAECDLVMTERQYESYPSYIVLRLNRPLLENLYQTLGLYLGKVHPECIGEVG
jgi:hypothetical protein